MKSKYLIPVLLIVSVFSFGLSGCCFGSGSSTPTTESEQSKEVKAFVYSQHAVKDSLKSPATAKFPMITNSEVIVRKISTDKYQVVAFVDSENSFGALIRANYMVTITFTGEDTYKWEDLILDN